MATNDRTLTVGTLAVAMALIGAATDALESPAAATRHAQVAAAMDSADVSAGGPALGLAIASQGNQALLDIRSEAARQAGLHRPSLPRIAHAATVLPTPAADGAATVRTISE